MRTATTSSRLLLTAATVCSLAACSGGGGDPKLTVSNGSLSLSLFDSPSTDVSEIWLQIDRVRVQPANDSAPLEFDFDPDLDVDLLTLTPDNALVLLAAQNLRARDYTWIEIAVNAAFDTIPDSYAVERIGGGVVELGVPGEVIRLEQGFTIEKDQETEFIVDWNTHQGLTFRSGDLGYTLLPALRVLDVPSFGTLSGTVETSLITPATLDNLCNADSPLDDPDIGNVVYVFSSGATPIDIRGIDAIVDPNVDPITTIRVAQDISGAYAYSTILAPGEYTLAFTCHAGLDDPLTDDILLFSDAVEVEIVAGMETIVDF